MCDTFTYECVYIILFNIFVQKGDKIEVIHPHDDGSWEGKHLKTGKVGMFPFNYVELLLDG